MAVNQNQNTLITNTPYLIVAIACTFTLRVKCHYLGFPGGSDGKESACNVGAHGSIPGSGRSPGEGNGYSLQYSWLENSMNRGAWRATVHGLTKVRHDEVT